jgi:hypothetical protein
VDTSTETASAGTATQDAGSQAVASGENTDVTEGAEGKQPEPTVRVGDRDVPLSVAENALKVSERFTQQSQELATQRKEIEAREARALEQEAAYGNLLPIIRDPRVADALRSVDPALADSIPREQDMMTRAMVGENLKLRYELFTSKHTDFNGEQLAAIRAEAAKLAAAGKVEEAVDFESIGYRLFRDQIIEREAERKATEAIAAEREKRKKEREAGTAGPGMPLLPKGVDPDKLSPVQKMQLGRALANAKKKR